MQPERRVLRSPNPTRAIRIFLARNATDAGLRAAVVSDDSGALLGGVGDVDHETLAAVGTALVGGDVGARPLGLVPPDIHASRLRVGEREFVVTSLGAPLGATAPLGEALARLLAA
ncbi:MAG: hypothetical protein U0168_12205 [Nannocystaceae bacterium]